MIHMFCRHNKSYFTFIVSVRFWQIRTTGNFISKINLTLINRARANKLRRNLRTVFYTFYTWVEEHVPHIQGTEKLEEEDIVRFQLTLLWISFLVNSVNFIYDNNVALTLFIGIQTYLAVGLL